MTRICTAFDRFESKRAKGSFSIQELQELREHLNHCPECRTQWFAQSELQQMAAAANLPELSARFNTQFRDRLHTRSELNSLSSRARHVMCGYWIIATVACITILARIEKPAWVTDTVIAGCGCGILFITYFRSLVPARWRKKTAHALNSLLE